MEAPFIGRARELQLLEREFKRNYSCVTLTGRRRVGKTRMVKEFLKGKKAMYFLATQSNVRDMLDSFSETCSRFSGREHDSFRNWSEAFRAFASCVEEKTVLVIDEFSYMVDTEKGFLKRFQGILDEILSPLPLMVILCGSHMSVMRSLSDDVGNPLYGRFTRRVTVLPLSFEEARGNRSYREEVERYAVLGGIPKYMELFEDGDLRRNVIENVFDHTSVMFEDPRVLLWDEVNEPAGYTSILGAISGGAVTVTKIASRVEIPATTLNPYLRKLMEIGMIRRVVPATEPHPERSKSGSYEIADNYTAFWFRFVLPYYSELSLGNDEWAVADFDRRFREAHVSFVFEELCREKTRRMSDRIGFIPERVGNYRRGDTELDVVALNSTLKRAFVAECKYRESEPVGCDVLEKLRRVTAEVKELEGYDVTFGLFSVTGFTDRVLEERDVVLTDQGEPVGSKQ